MITDPTLPSREINKRLLLTLHQDGFLDMLAGLIVITFGFIPILDETGLSPGLRQVILLSVYGVSVFTILRFKRRVTVPRSGFVKLPTKTTSRLSLIMLIVNVLLFLTFAGVYIFEIPVWETFGSFQLSVPLGLIFLIMLTVSGALLKAARFYIYGILVFTSFLCFEYLFAKGLVAHHGIPLAGFISGGIIMSSGFFLLYKFVRKYSVEN